REHGDPALEQDVVRLRRRGPVRALPDDLRLDPPRVRGRDLVLERAWCEDLDVELQEVLVRDLLRARVPLDAPRLLLEREDLHGVESGGVVDAARGIGDRDDLRALL